ncbi:MAG TPA: T9SS type A sorting domain-containing protein [Candidatus Didemnitutus sp.]|nr:T9SS type A sorting domain-containing protein [Candidatus Didemnitutus sp.]
MKYVIMAMLMAGVCMGQTVVDLPSSFILFQSNEKLACVATSTTICYGPTAETITECSIVPAGIDFVSGSWSIRKMAIDPQGRYVYVCVRGADGLFRFDIENEVWRVINPPTAGTDPTALFVDSAGAVVVGTGGGAGSYAVNARGMFRTTDFGETWFEINIRDPTLNMKPGVSAIQSTDSGKLVVGFRQYYTTRSSGVYVEQDSGRWVKAGVSGEPDQLVVSGGVIYSVGFGFAMFVDLNKTPWEQRTLSSTQHDITIQPWNKDTVAVCIDNPKDIMGPRVFMKVGGLSVDTVQLVARPITNNSIHFATDVRPIGSSQFIALGCGRNSIVDSHGADVGTIAPGIRLAEAPQIFQTHSWTSARVAEHGWYSIEADRSAHFDTLFSRDIIGYTPVVFNADGVGYLACRQNLIISVRKRKMDTLVRVNSDTIFRSACRTSDGSIIVPTRRQRLLSYSPLTKSWSSFSTEGLPDKVIGGPLTDSHIRYVFVIGEDIYAWVDNPQPTTDTLGGLYVFRSVWSRVDIPQLPDNSGLQSVASDNDGVVLTISGEITSANAESMAIHVRSEHGQPAVSILSAENEPRVRLSICSEKTIAWINLVGDVLSSSDPNATPVLVRSSSNHTIGRVGNRLLVATRDSGLLLYDNPLIISGDPRIVQRNMQVNPQPASARVTISVNNTSDLIHHTNVYNLAGELVLSLDHEPSNTVTIPTDGLSSGVYLARVTTTSAITTIPISILAH